MIVAVVVVGGGEGTVIVVVTADVVVDVVVDLSLIVHSLSLYKPLMSLVYSSEEDQTQALQDPYRGSALRIDCKNNPHLVVLPKNENKY